MESGERRLFVVVCRKSSLDNFATIIPNRFFLNRINLIKMENSLEFLTRMHKKIEGSKTYPFNCSRIAFEMAKTLVSEGKKPSILLVEKKTRVLQYCEYLKPKRYNGKVCWAWHSICCENDLVYDPIINAPIRISEYLKNSFENEVEANVVKTPDEIISAVYSGRSIDHLALGLDLKNTYHL